MIGIVDPANLPDAFIFNGEKVGFAFVKDYFVRRYGKPVSGYCIECTGTDGARYHAAARVIFEKDGFGEYVRKGWDVEFYSTKKAAAHALKTGWRRVFSDEFNEEDAA